MKAVVNDTEVYYIDVGRREGLPIVFIHGFPFSHEMWQPQIQLLEKEFRAVAYDIRGHGEAGVGDGQYMLEFFVDDLVGLLDFLRIEKAVLCGLSMGGYIALRMVERNPERVRALVLADTQSKADSNEAKLRRAASIKAVRTKGVEAYAENFLKTAFAADSFRKKPDVVEKIRRIIVSNWSQGVCAALLALATRTDTTDALPNIKVPTLILVGEHDTLTPPSASQEMHSKIQNSEIHIIPDSAHLSNLENPDEFNKYLRNFLEKLTPVS
jgi:3-oxoadipate enol-lactonase